MLMELCWGELGVAIHATDLSKLQPGMSVGVFGCGPIGAHMKYAIGVDFGTESGRVVLVEVNTGVEIATAVYSYSNGVIDEKLPESGVLLDPDWALQDPEDYIRVYQNAIPQVLSLSGVDPADVIGVGIDFTACTMLPVKADGPPLCTLPEWRATPHAWVKLWKHHAAQPEANKIYEYFASLHPEFGTVVDEKMSRNILSMGQKAGGLCERAAARTGLLPGTAVAMANVDAHVAVPAATVTEPGRMVMIMGTSICHMVLGTEEHIVPGMCGCVEDGIIPGLFGYEAGQSCVGDHFAWFVENSVPCAYWQEANECGRDIHDLLEEKAAKLRPGEIGLLALDWWNGNRSILVDVDLTGLLIGATLSTKPEEIYRALIEATAFGTRVIVETFQKNGVPIFELVACGGLPEKNKLLMQIYADMTG